MMVLSQIFIAVFGISAVFLSQMNDLKYRRWSSVCGLISQPFWFYTAWMTGSWGIFILCFFYTWAWALGFWNTWIVPYLESRRQ